MMDEAGFPDTTIVLSNELDELSIWQILTQIGQEAARNGLDADRLIRRLAYGVGTRLVTSAGDSALNGVYKLVALRRESRWVPAMKLSDSPSKIPNPGDKRAWRLYDRRGKATADLLSAKDEVPADQPKIVLRHMTESNLKRSLVPKDLLKIEPLLIDVCREGRTVLASPSIEQIRALRQSDMERLDPGVKRLMNPHIYHVSLTEKVWQVKQKMIASMRSGLPGKAHR
jgi:nicotinate phosphoribosyltransferase